MSEASKPRLVGINHIAIEVGDIDQALDFYAKIFDFKLRAKRPGNGTICAPTASVCSAVDIPSSGHCMRSKSR